MNDCDNSIVVQYRVFFSNNIPIPIPIPHSQDISRLIDRKIKLRDLILKRDQSQYAFPSFSGLKTPEEYASHKIFTVNRKWWRDTMHEFTTVLIPTCLMNVSKELEKPAVLLYKNILGYMKTRKYVMNE